MKGNSTTHIFTQQGRVNYGQIKKACGCVLGTKCEHETQETFEEEKKKDGNDTNED
jgi:hypothetical protein